MEQQFAIPENYSFRYRGPPRLTSNEQMLLDYMFVNFAVICQVFVIVGIVTNIINIIVFKKMGFKETVNISLVALSVSDLFSCATMVFQNITLNPYVQDLDLSFDPNEVHFIVCGWPHAMFTRITSVITTFITFERFLCVTFPFKVRTLITRKRVIVVMVSTFVLIIGGILPVYATHRLGSKFSYQFNKTLIGLMYKQGHETMESVMYYIFTIIFPIILYAVIVVCTVFLIISLKRKSKWRQSAAATVTQSNEMAAKERRIATMVATVSTLFIACYSPIIIVIAFMLVDEEFSIVGERWVLFGVFFSSIFILESVNSSLNIFIYYSKNSKYRAKFNQIFCRGIGTKPDMREKN